MSSCMNKHERSREQCETYGTSVTRRSSRFAFMRFGGCLLVVCSLCEDLRALVVSDSV